MKKLFLFIALVVTFYKGWGEERLEDRVMLSSPEEVANAISTGNTLIGGIISPLSGQPVLRETDLVVQGAEPLTFSRTYIPPSIPSSFSYHKTRQKEWNNFYLANHLVSSYKGWVFLPHLRLEYFTNDHTLRVPTRSGMTLDFKLSGPSTLISPPYGISNLAHENPSGKQDPRNIRVYFNNDQNIITVHYPDGSISEYGNKYRTHANRALFLLLKETLPNGRKIVYSYDPYKHLKSIAAKDPSETLTYGQIDLPNSINCDGETSISSSTSSLKTQYTQVRRSLLAKLEKDPFKGEKVDKFHWNPLLPSLLTDVQSPFFKTPSTYNSHFLLTRYSGRKEDFALSYASYQGRYKVQTLSLPLGKDGALHRTYTFDYASPDPGKSGGYTLVKNPDNTFIRYHISENLLLTAIEWLDQSKTLQKRQIYKYSEKHHLKAIEIQDAKGAALYKKTFECDPFGNPKKETLHGNLTGEGQEETYSIDRTYSQDGKNRVLQEVEEGGKTTEWEYLKGTDLVTKKLIKDHKRILQRFFYFYDAHHNHIQTITDDGSGIDPQDLTNVISRYIQTYHLRKTPPFLHMVDCLEESFIENGQELLLKKIQYQYDSYGNIKEERMYGSDGKLAYVITKTYNEKGELLSETNPLGHSANYDYNSHGSLTKQTSFSGRKEIHNTYDKKQRLIHAKETGERITYHTSYAYDFLDHLTKKTDPFGNPTTYTYDPLTHQVTHTCFPTLPSIDQQSLAVETHTQYDLMGRPIVQTNANGFATYTTYTTHGKPLQITHPDRTTEHFRYTKKGELAIHTDQNGTQTHYTRDTFGRVLRKVLISSSGEEIADENFTYSGFHPLTSTDKEGYTTTYSYDGAGRKIQEKRAGRVVRYGYDPLGYLETVTQENGVNTLVTRYQRDALGQILEKTEEDLAGNILHLIAFNYDADGNQTTIKKTIDGNISQTTTTYDPFGRIETVKDPLGHLWHTTYNEAYTNAIGQNVLQTLEADPLERTLIKTFDAHGNLSSKEILSSNSETLSKTIFFYDPEGNLTDQQDHCYLEGEFLDTTILHFTHTPKGYLKDFTEGYNTPHSRTTTYTYTPRGLVQTKTLPNDVKLSYTYDPLGRLQTLASEDLYHTFAYNKLGHLLYAADENIQVTRTLDPFGNILTETLSTGLTLEKEYDQLNRTSALHIPHTDPLIYTYDPLYLKAIEKQGKYTHTYSHYDPCGNPLEEELIFNLGPLHHSYDLIGRKQETGHSLFSQEAYYDPLGNLKHATQDQTLHFYTYDSLNQLIQEDTSTYAYDSLHNPTQKDSVPVQTGPHHTLLTQGQDTYTYDHNGNRTSYHTHQYHYDSLNRLIQVATPNTQATYTYDPLGRRLSKTIVSQGYFFTSQTEEYYLYDGEDEIGAFSKEGIPHTLKIPGYQGRPIVIEINGYPYAPLIDIHDNITKLLDPHKQIQATYHYSAFGEKGPTYHNNPYRYKGKRFDPETGFVYFGKRYYDPHTHRFLTTDPLGFVNSTNLYQYVFNNPFRYTDPDGQLAFAIPIIIWGAEAILPTLAYAVATAAVAYASYKGVQMLNERTNHPEENTSTLPNTSPSDPNKEKEPPFNGKNLGDDPTKPPAEGFEWKGKGTPESGKGNWTRGKDRTKESLHPDLDHAEPYGPHWDYRSHDYPKGVRLYPDGSWEVKP